MEEERLKYRIRGTIKYLALNQIFILNVSLTQPQDPINLLRGVNIIICALELFTYPIPNAPETLRNTSEIGLIKEVALH